MNYCLGFILNKDLTKILLVKKNRGPKQLIGKLNGIGGKLEKGEVEHQAIIRECKEETGLDINCWNYFCTIEYLEDQITCFYSVTNDIFNYSQIEDETINIYRIYDFTEYNNYVPQLDWLIPMILNHQNGSDPTIAFKVKLL